MLRPFAGIKEYNLHEVIECLYLLQDELASDKLNKAIPHAILNLVATLQGAVLHPSSSLLRNRLIDEAGVEKLTAWLGIIMSASLCYMRGLGHAVALSGYLEYLLREPPGLPYAEAPVHAAVADSFDRNLILRGKLNTSQVPSCSVCAIQLSATVADRGDGIDGRRVLVLQREAALIVVRIGDTRQAVASRAEAAVFPARRQRGWVHSFSYEPVQAVVDSGSDGNPTTTAEGA